MIEQKLIVGRYLELVTPPPVFAAPAALGFREQTAVVLHIDESEWSAAPMTARPNLPGLAFKEQVKVDVQRAGQHIKSQFDQQRVSTTGTGPVAKTHRNFVWLEWMGGIVNEVQVQGRDILTGPMSGCWIMSYMRGNVHYIGHVGTVNLRTDQQSIDARAAWNTFAASVPMGSYSGFNPFNDPWVGPVPTGLPGEAARKTFALVSGAGHFYTIITFPQANKPTRIRIAGIQQNASSLPQGGQI